MRRSAFLATLTAGLLLGVPTAALAHPALNPSSIPAGRTVDAVLVVPHGCAPGGGMPDMAADGTPAEATVELAVQHVDGVTLTPADVEGWDVTDDGEAWVWSDAGGATTEVIEFPLTVSLDEGLPAGERHYLPAYQECVDGSAFQWIATPEVEAEWPAVLLEVSDGEVGEAEPDDGMAMDHDGMDMGDEEPMEMDDEAVDDDAMDEDMAMDDGGVDEESGGLSTGLVVLLGVLAAAVVGGVVVRARSTT